MQIQNPTATTRCNELDLIAQHLPLDNATVLELGCGKAQMTRRIAERFPTVRIIATEVDQIQHANNLETQRSLSEVEGNPHPITFKLGGAQAIDAPDNSIDVVFMFKSLHHVPRELMAQSLQEIARVLKPGGLVWISEPVYAGDFNDILRLFHDEKVVRELAFQVCDAVDAGTLELVEQIFCHTESRFADFNEFDERIIQVTHTNHQLDDALYQTVKARFNAHVGASGAAFENPARFDVLRKPYCAL
ncbi:MAG: SAM-dependent methyltransferase [Thiothrix lacustris]|uniref:SAM-dependent methyltransferase n=1 Tax=Thiothrix lacustris TaxID=525917 RepID=A0A1Y1Q784_9GAMM|nr:MAG: SAM-dependent methyltransferase [Thiothrix lacustris]